MLQQAMKTGRLRLAAGAVAWGAAEATLFFVVADVLISWAALKRGWRTAVLVAICCAAGAVAGGAVVHRWSGHAPEVAARWIEAVPAVPAGAVARAEVRMRDGWFFTALAGAFQGEPYKVWSAAAPAAGVPVETWAAASVPIRLPRFLLAAAAFSVLGAVLRGRLSPRVLSGLFAAGWAIFYLAFWLTAAG